MVDFVLLICFFLFVDVVGCLLMFLVVCLFGCLFVVWQDSTDDYTGHNLPSIWHLEPSEDTFSVQLHRKGTLKLDVTRIQYPLAPLAAGRYNNAQGKTVKGIGHTIDFTKPNYLSADDYTQHLHMILEGAQPLALPTTRTSIFCF